jgi:amino acid transporter
MQPSNHRLKRELKVRDLVLMQILVIVSLNLSGYAAKQGRSQVVLWLLAMALFYLPQGAIVIWLSRVIPLEGGVYQWVKQGFSPFAGYIAGWTFTLYIICWYASFGSQVASGIAYVGGSSGAWMNTSKVFTLSMTVALCLLAFLLNVRGLHVTKWLSGAGSLLLIAVFLIMVYLLVRLWAKTKSFPEVAFSLAWPSFSLLTVNVFTKMSLFALSRLDECSIFSEECRKPKNDVARSVLIAAPFIALMYIASTTTVLAYIPVANVDLAAPVPQVMQAGFGSTAAGWAFASISVGVYCFALIATLIVVVGMVARLPMAAGWDGLLPAWFSQLHPRFGTPTKAVAAVSAALLLMGVLSLFGAHNQEAVQVLAAVAFGSYCITYMLLFGAVVFGFRSTEWRPGIALRLGAFLALLVTVLAFVVQLLPVGEVASPWLFAMKVTGASARPVESGRTFTGVGVCARNQGALRRFPDSRG